MRLYNKYKKDPRLMQYELSQKESGICKGINMILKKGLIVLTLAYSICLQASSPYENRDKEDVFYDATVQSCYGISMSVGMVNCMGTVASRYYEEYNKEYKKFLERNRARKNGYSNYHEFINAAMKAKENWDKYVEQECLVSAYYFMKDSYAFYTENYACQADFYLERAKYYKENPYN